MVGFADFGWLNMACSLLNWDAHSSFDARIEDVEKIWVAERETVDRSGFIQSQTARSSRFVSSPPT